MNKKDTCRVLDRKLINELIIHINKLNFSYTNIHLLYYLDKTCKFVAILNLIIIIIFC